MGKKIIKILIVGVSKNCGGIETLFYGLFGKQKSDVYDIEFVTFSDKCAFEDVYVNLGYKIHHLPSRRSNPLKFNKTVIGFFSKNNDYDYIWVNTASTSLYQFQYYGKKYTQAKIITHSHGMKMENTSLITALINEILALLNRRKVLNNTDIFMGCSYSAATALFGKKYKDKFVVVTNGAEIEKFAFNEGSRKEIRKEFRIGDNTLLLGMVGRISGIKNPIRMLEIFVDYLKINPDTKLLFVGKGELEELLRQKVKEYKLENKVILSGFRTDANRIFSGLDVLLMPSKSEGMPLSAVEAQICGLPCVLSSVITDEVVISDLIEFVSLKATNDDWVKAIEKLRKNKFDRASYAKKAYDTQFNIDNTRKRIKEIIN